MAAWRRVPMGPWAAAPPLLPRTHPGLCTRAGLRDPYAVLGVQPEASPAEIRAAFLARCKEVHPDRDPADPTRHRRFLLLAEAYRALTPPRGPPPRGPPPQGPPPHGTPPPRGPPPRSEPPPRADPTRRYWEQFGPPRTPPPGAPPPRLVLGLCLLLGALGALAHALAYRYVAGAHATFLDERDRILTAAWERARSRAGSREEVLQRLRASRRRRRGGGEGGP